MSSPSSSDGALDLGDIEPGIPAGHPRPAAGAHPWAPSEFDHRETAPGVTGSSELEDAVAEYRRLERLEIAAQGVVVKLGNLRAEAAERARELGWRG